jgi:hypothetical protein
MNADTFVITYVTLATVFVLTVWTLVFAHEIARLARSLARAARRHWLERRR